MTPPRPKRGEPRSRLPAPAEQQMLVLVILLGLIAFFTALLWLTP